MTNNEQEMENGERRGKLTVNFDPEDVAKFLAGCHVYKVTSGGHELLFGDDC
jgi:hypothetical protein